MNKNDRKQLEEIKGKIESAIAELESLQQPIADLQGQEQERYDNLSEKAQDGDRGQELYELANALQEAYDSLEEATGRAQDAFDTLENIE